jgi:hypothetical protein
MAGTRTASQRTRAKARATPAAAAGRPARRLARVQRAGPDTWPNILTPGGALRFQAAKGSEAARVRAWQRAAMQWSYIVRNRSRWAGLGSATGQQADRAARLLQDLGLDDASRRKLADAGVAQVVVPFREEDVGWEGRIFPWEFVLSAGTRRLRAQPLIVMRQLARSDSPSAPRARTPRSVLYVESAPDILGEGYSFESERSLVRSGLGLSWHELLNPTRAELARAVKDVRPDVIHLAGFDTHQGLQLLGADEDSVRVRPEEYEDGYFLSGPTRGPDFISAQELAAILTGGRTKPALVGFSMWNSAGRMAALTVAAGAAAAVAFQDSIEDALVELLFSRLYRHWRDARWDLRPAFLSACEALRSRPGMVGSGVVLWSEAPLVGPGVEVSSIRRRAQAAARSRLQKVERGLVDPGSVAAARLGEYLKVTVDPPREVNYALLHNGRPLFETFKIARLRPGRYVDFQVTTELHVGEATFPFRRTFDLADDDPPDVRADIHVALTSALARGVRESVATSLFLEVAWGKHILHRDTTRVRLLPPDQWRDTDEDRRWLPSFVLPRDPAVAEVVEKARRYVRVLRDDPAAGFDGYQSLDPDREDPAEEVDLQVQAIWSALVHEWGLGYINPPPAYSRHLDSQRLRTPSAVRDERAGTCIDLALLLAACLELVDIYPVVFLLDGEDGGHAFPGYWRSNEAHGRFVQVGEGRAEAGTRAAPRRTGGDATQPWMSGRGAYDEIVRQVDEGNLVPIETVALTEHKGLWAAVEAARENVADRDEFQAMVDVIRARGEGVTPLPISDGRP